MRKYASLCCTHDGCCPHASTRRTRITICEQRMNKNHAPTGVLPLALWNERGFGFDNKPAIGAINQFAMRAHLAARGYLSSCMRIARATTTPAYIGSMRAHTITRNSGLALWVSWYKTACSGLRTSAPHHAWANFVLNNMRNCNDWLSCCAWPRRIDGHFMRPHQLSS